MNDYHNITKLISTKIPLKASFAEICERMWIRVLQTTENMPLSPNWPGKHHYYHLSTTSTITTTTTTITITTNNNTNTNTKHFENV